jgi:glycerol uptake facilitator-like aquaporin
MASRRKPTTKGIFKGLMAELLGSLVFTFVTVCAFGTGHLISSAGWVPARLLVDAVVYGLSYSFCVYLTMFHTWECHFFNPAVAAAVVLTHTAASEASQWGSLRRHAKAAKLFAVFGVQLLGTVLGACLVFAVIPNSVGNRDVLAAPRLRFGSTFGSGFLLEALGTFFLTMLVLVAVNFHPPLTRSSSIAVAAGFGSTALQLFLFPFTSACLNPARALALLLCSWSFSVEAVLYLAAPFVGSLLAVLFFLGVFSSATGGNARDSGAGMIYDSQGKRRSGGSGGGGGGGGGGITPLAAEATDSYPLFSTAATTTTATGSGDNDDRGGFVEPLKKQQQISGTYYE